MNDELKNQLKKLDPMHPGVQSTPPSRDRLEEIMANTETTQPNRAPWYAAAAVAVVVIGLAIAIPALNGGSPTTTTTPTTIVSAGPPLELSLGDGGAMASCMVFDVEFLRELPVAFEGTVTGVDGESVTLTVDRWFKGGDAATVELTAPAGMEALIGGIEFVEGEQYLITAAEGSVNYCGFSGPATPEFRASFEEAFVG
jgi:hypothetical protein